MAESLEAARKKRIALAQAFRDKLVIGVQCGLIDTEVARADFEAMVASLEA